MSTLMFVIVGGGPAGASAAIQLARAGARVLLAERERFPRPKLCGEFISPECLDHFARLGVLEQMSGAGGARVSRDNLLRARGPRASRCRARGSAAAAARALGLSRAEMDARLLARARAGGRRGAGRGVASADVRLIEGGRVRGVRLSVGRRRRVECRARVTLDATGRHRASCAAPSGEAARRSAKRRGDARRSSPSRLISKARAARRASAKSILPRRLRRPQPGRRRLEQPLLHRARARTCAAAGATPSA